MKLLQACSKRAPSGIRNKALTVVLGGPQLASRSFAKKTRVKIGKCPSGRDVSAGKLAICSLGQCSPGNDSLSAHTPTPVSLAYVAPGYQGHYIATRWT